MFVETGALAVTEELRDGVRTAAAGASDLERNHGFGLADVDSVVVSEAAECPLDHVFGPTLQISKSASVFGGFGRIVLASLHAKAVVEVLPDGLVGDEVIGDLLNWDTFAAEFFAGLAAGNVVVALEELVVVFGVAIDESHSRVLHRPLQDLLREIVVKVSEACILVTTAAEKSIIQIVQLVLGGDTIHFAPGSVAVHRDGSGCPRSN